MTKTAARHLAQTIYQVDKTKMDSHIGQHGNKNSKKDNKKNVCALTLQAMDYLNFLRKIAIGYLMIWICNDVTEEMINLADQDVI